VCNLLKTIQLCVEASLYVFKNVVSVLLSYLVVSSRCISKFLRSVFHSKRLTFTCFLFVCNGIQLPGLSLVIELPGLSLVIDFLRCVCVGNRFVVFLYGSHVVQSSVKGSCLRHQPCKWHLLLENVAQKFN